MRCKAPRKGPRRPRSKTITDDNELAELAAVIAEHKLDNNSTGWFKPPWRDGWNAVELAARAGRYDSWLFDVCLKRRTDQEIYWAAQDRLSTTISPYALTRAALRCLQVLIANSSGGGEIYNAILLEPFSTLLPENVAHLVMEHRCRDSIGVSAQMEGDGNDRLRRAFTTAWSRGLYLAAYSLPPATVKGQLKLKVLK
jgi:hypothetical protein